MSTHMDTMQTAKTGRWPVETQEDSLDVIFAAWELEAYPLGGQRCPLYARVVRAFKWADGIEQAHRPRGMVAGAMCHGYIVA